MRDEKMSQKERKKENTGIINSVIKYIALLFVPPTLCIKVMETEGAGRGRGRGRGGVPVLPQG